MYPLLKDSLAVHIYLVCALWFVWVFLTLFDSFILLEREASGFVSR